jgi:HupE / UreJ protein
VLTWGELQAGRDDVLAWVRDGVRVADARGRCDLQPVRMGLRRYDDGAYVAVELGGACADGALRVDYDLLFDRDPQHRAIATLHEGTVTASAILRFDARHATLGRASGSPFAAFVREGVHHILIGTDHLAFLLCLLLPATLVRRDGAWIAAASLGASLRPVLGIVTAFTLAHSLTLSLAALGWVVPSSRWVEAAIAGSVLLAALNNVRPVVERRTWMVAFVFGLVHGFGFAGALGEFGLPADSRLAALVGFNAGVELGQLAAVAAVLPLLHAWRRRTAYARVVMPLVSLLIAAVAARWCWERLAG